MTTAIIPAKPRTALSVELDGEFVDLQPQVGHRPPLTLDDGPTAFHPFQEGSVFGLELRA